MHWLTLFLVVGFASAVHVHLKDRKTRHHISSGAAAGANYSVDGAATKQEPTKRWTAPWTRTWTGGREDLQVCTELGNNRWYPDNGGCCNSLLECAEPREVFSGAYCESGSVGYGTTCWDTIVMCQTDCKQAPPELAAAVPKQLAVPEQPAAAVPEQTAAAVANVPEQIESPGAGDAGERPALSRVDADFGARHYEATSKDKACTALGGNRWFPDQGGCCEGLLGCTEPRPSASDIYCASGSDGYGNTCWDTMDICLVQCSKAAASPASADLMRTSYGLMLLPLFVGGVVLTAMRKEPSERYKMESYLMCRTSSGAVPLKQTLKDNALPAATVALVALPLSIALGIASGATPVMGLSTAVIAGSSMGLFGVSHFSVVGPAGALVAILLRYATLYGAEIIPWLSLISALCIILTAASGLHVYCLLMPKSVFEGFMLSIAFTIGLGQTNFALGLSPGPPVEIRGFEMSPVFSKLLASMSALDTISANSMVFFIASMVVLLSLYRWKPSIPWITPYSVLAVAFGVFSELIFGSVAVPTLKDQYGILRFQLATPLSPLNSIIAASSNGSMADVIIGGVSVAFVGILETLIVGKLCALKHGMKFTFRDTDRELQGLAIAHLACGFCGAMPPTGVIVPSTVNQTTGATHGSSQAMQAFALLMLAGVCMPLFSDMPLPAVAAVLATACCRMIPYDYIGKLYSKHPKTLCLFTLVVAICFAVDSVNGLLFGIVCSLLAVGRELSDAQAGLSMVSSAALDVNSEVAALDIVAINAGDLDSAEPIDVEGRLSVVEAAFKSSEGESTMTATPKGKRTYVYDPHGQLDYLSAEIHSDRLCHLMDEQPMGVVFGLQQTPWVDADGLEVLEAIDSKFRKAEVDFYIAGCLPRVRAELEPEEWFQRLVEERRVHGTVSSALKEIAHGWQSRQSPSTLKVRLQPTTSTTTTPTTRAAPNVERLLKPTEDGSVVTERL